jgi:hypothetical protein
LRSPASAALIAAAVVLGVAFWSARPAAPRPADIPETEFSEVRAAPIVERLARTKRVAGSPECDDALAYLEQQLRAIPELEVEIQEVTAHAQGPYSGPSIYTVRNLLARLPGTELAHEAVLVAAHYDSAVMSPGAADDGVGVATVVETARCLAAGPRPSRSIVFLLDEGEELGLFGAQGFLHHRWAKDVVTYVNLEAAGCKGRPILFQTGPGDPWLASAYARSVPHPHGTVMGQDVFQSGVIPSDTDFRVYRDEGKLRGLDVALYRDGWGYHTTRDTVDRLEKGSLQEMGDNTLAVLREMAAMDIPSGHIASSAVYYDIAGTWMLSYGSPAAWLLALIAIASLAHALLVAGRARGIGVAGFAGGAVWAAGALAAAALVTFVLASVLDVWREEVSGWYARPWLAVVAYGLPAAVVVLLAARWAVLLSVSTPVSAATRLAGGAGLLFAVLLAWATWSGVGSGYLALWWVVGATAAVRLAAHGRLATAVVVGAAFPALLTIQAADALIATFVPIAGRMGGPLEHIIAFIAALPIAFGLLLPAAFVAAAPPRWGRGALWLAVLGGVAGCIAVASVFPYTAERAKRVEYAYSRHVDAERGAWHAPVAGDALRELNSDDAFPAARLVVLGDAPVPEGITRRVRAHLQVNGATGVTLWFDRGTVARIVAGESAAWTRPPPSERDAVGGADGCAFVASPREGLALTFDLLTDDVEIHLRTWHVHVPPDVQQTLDDLPDWITPEAEAEIVTTQRL